MNVLAALVTLALLIVVHEAGHFLAARMQGIHVSGFSVGFGPAILSTQRQGVTYALRLLPLGGFVSFPDDDETSDIPFNDPDLLRNRPVPQRIFVIVAGVLANLLLAWLVILGQAVLAGLPTNPDPGVLVVAVQPGSAADKAGLRTGDQLLSINGQLLGSGQEAVRTMVERIRTAPGVSLNLETQRNGERSTLYAQPSEQQGQGWIGAQLQANISVRTRPVHNPLEAISYTNGQIGVLLQRTLNGYLGLITNFRNTVGQVGGPVKIVEMGAQLSQQGPSGLILFTALISVNLAVLNAMPLPLLDGGQLLLLLIESLRGKPIPEKLQLAFLQSGFLLIVGLSVILIVRDTSQLRAVQQLIER
ncbi:RIP metalloprotease RseP [cyanobiont of Ornithocercus magnificus]|nr:RIP metalloprotease RseP [cyanobiont of Ornithocercus magnificus]